MKKRHLQFYRIVSWLALEQGLSGGRDYSREMKNKFQLIKFTYVPSKTSPSLLTVADFPYFQG